MSQFERDLRESLRRREPPPGFAGRVLARTREIDERSERRSAWKWSWRWVTVAAAVVMLVAGVSLYQEHQRQVPARCDDGRRQKQRRCSQSRDAEPPAAVA